MARIIEFYVPVRFRPQRPRRISTEARGKLIVFRPHRDDTYIWLPNGAQWEVLPNARRATGGTK